MYTRHILEHLLFPGPPLAWPGHIHTTHPGPVNIVTELAIYIAINNFQLGLVIL
jgi:hypothetical protein